MAHLRFNRSQKTNAKQEAQKSFRPQTNLQPSSQNDHDLGNQPSILRKPLFQGLSGELKGSSFPIQTKLMIGESGDKYEQEADRVAAEVVQQLNSPALDSASEGVSIQRQSEDPPQVMRMSTAPASASDFSQSPSPEVESAINSARGKGKPLPENFRKRVEPLFGANFSDIRIHTDDRADKLSKLLHARAFTTGPDIFFRQGEFNTDTQAGQFLINHELRHAHLQGQNNNSSTIQCAGDDIMYRVPASQVHKTGRHSFVQDEGQLRKATPASNGNYVFSEKGAGVQPITMIGRPEEVKSYLGRNAHRSIENQNETLPDIYMRVEPFQSKDRFRSLNPVGEAASQVIGGAAGLAAGGLGEVYGHDLGYYSGTVAGVSDTVGNTGLKNLPQKAKQLFSGKKKNTSSDLVAVTLDYRPGTGRRIGSGRVRLGDIKDYL